MSFEPIWFDNEHTVVIKLGAGFDYEVPRAWFITGVAVIDFPRTSPSNEDWVRDEVTWLTGPHELLEDNSSCALVVPATVDVNANEFPPYDPRTRYGPAPEPKLTFFGWGVDNAWTTWEQTGDNLPRGRVRVHATIVVRSPNVSLIRVGYSITIHGIGY